MYMPWITGPVKLLLPAVAGQHSSRSRTPGYRGTELQSCLCDPKHLDVRLHLNFSDAMRWPGIPRCGGQPSRRGSVRRNTSAQVSKLRRFIGSCQCHHRSLAFGMREYRLAMLHLNFRTHGQVTNASHVQSIRRRRRSKDTRRNMSRRK